MDIYIRKVPITTIFKLNETNEHIYIYIYMYIYTSDVILCIVHTD